MKVVGLRSFYTITEGAEEAEVGGSEILMWW